MKRLTQADFERAPEWAKSLAVDSNGELHAYHALKKWLLIDDTYHHAPLGSYSEIVCTGYDATDWQNSAIDREVSQ